MIPYYLSPLANHLWQSTLFAVAAGLLTLAFKKNRAAVRHWLWLAASVKFLIPFSLLVTIGSQFQWRASPAIPQPQVSVMIGQISEPFTPAAAVEPAGLTAKPSRTAQIPMILFSVWLCGVGFSILAWTNRWRKIRNILRLATPLDLGLPIKVLTCSDRLEPGVFGIVRPVLILPDGIADRLTPDQLQAILAHELCHVRRRDNLAAAIHMIVEAIFWFHPLVWWIETRLVEEQENACDEDVLRLGSDPQTYAEGILKVCEFYLQSPLACVSGVTGSDLKKRIAKIMRNGTTTKLNWIRSLFLALAATAVIGGPIVMGGIQAKQQSSNDTVERFQVVSIKPANPNFGGRGGANANPCGETFPRIDPQQFSVEGDTVCALIRTAYNLGLTPFASASDRLTGGPDWIRWDRFAIQAVMPEGFPVYTAAQLDNGHAERLRNMIRTLLADRFKLVVHHETREVPVYVLTAPKGGLKLQWNGDRQKGEGARRASEGDCIDFEKLADPKPPFEKPPCGISINHVGGPIGMLTMHGGTLEGLSRNLQPYSRSSDYR